MPWTNVRRILRTRRCALNLSLALPGDALLLGLRPSFQIELDESITIAVLEVGLTDLKSLGYRGGASGAVRSLAEYGDEEVLR